MWAKRARERVVGDAPARPRQIAQPNTCFLPTDVALGWLTTQAFAGRALQAVNLFQIFELFVWPSSRFNRNHTLVMHLAGNKVGDFSGALDSFDAKVDRGSTPLVPPQLWCSRARWLHTATKNWSECWNVAPCASVHARPPPPPPPPPNPPLVAVPTKPSPPSFEGWFPAPVRGVCHLFEQELAAAKAIL